MNRQLDYQKIQSLDSVAAIEYPEILTNLELLPNIPNKDGVLTGWHGQVNTPGQVHPLTVLDNEKRCRETDGAAKAGHIKMLDHYGTPLFVLHPDEIWYRIVLRKPQHEFLLRLRAAGQSGLIFSGSHPQITLNDGRKWTCLLRQNGICISTSVVHPSERPEHDEHASRYVLHGRVTAVPPDGATVGRLYDVAADAVPDFVENREMLLHERHAESLRRVQEVPQKFGMLSVRRTTGNGSETPPRSSAARKGGPNK